MKRIFILIYGIFGVLIFGQTLSSQLSDSILVLGEVGEIQINILDVNGSQVKAPQKNEILPFDFEILSDSIQKSENDYSRKVKFQIFEEGKYKLSPIEFQANGKVLKTIPYQISVIHTAKQGDQISDIKQNKKVKLSLWDYWDLYKYYIIGVLALLLLIYVVYKIAKFTKKQNSPARKYTNKTLKDLENLKKKKYIEQSDYRSFYVEFIDIIRSFLSERYRFPARELLSDDLLNYMKAQKIVSEEDFSLLTQVFSRGDLTKFAKAIPDKSDMEKDFNEVKTFVKKVYKEAEMEKEEENDE